MRKTGAIALTAVLSFVVLAWGTCPCLYAGVLVGDTTDEAPCACCAEKAAEKAPMKSGTDDCPTCSSVGCMHELPPVGDRVTLDAPALTAFLPSFEVDAPRAVDLVPPQVEIYDSSPAASTEVLIV